MSDTIEENVAVEQLLAERDALHGWLQRLDAATVAASAVVRERVRRDYQQQLDRVADDLRTHADAIAEKLAEDQAEHDELSGRTEASREQLAEVELRHAVGEFSPERYQADRTRHLSDIETFELSLAAVGGRIQRMGDVLALVRRAPPTSGQAVTDAPAQAPPEMSILELAPAESPAPGSAGSGEAIASVEVMVTADAVDIDQVLPEDETDRILSIFSASTERQPEGAGESSPTTPSPGLPEFGPLSFRPAGTAPPREPALIGLPADSPPRFVRPGDRLPASPPARSAGLSATASVSTPPPVAVPEAPAPVKAGQGIFSEEIVASGPTPPVPTMPVGRTLRCGECGAMNRPLEWYCEKCGAELSAV